LDKKRRSEHKRYGSTVFHRRSLYNGVGSSEVLDRIKGATLGTLNLTIVRVTTVNEGQNKIETDRERKTMKKGTTIVISANRTSGEEIVAKGEIIESGNK